MLLTVQIDTLRSYCLEYHCSHNMLHVASVSMISLIDIHPVFTEQSEFECFYRGFHLPMGSRTESVSMRKPIHKLSLVVLSTHEFHANL